MTAPAPITEKAVAIAFFFAALGCSIHLGYHNILSSERQVTSFLSTALDSLFGTRLLLIDEPAELLRAMRAPAPAAH